MKLKKSILAVSLFGAAISASAQVPTRTVSASTATPTITVLSRTYRLGSYNQKHHPTWEFVPGNENINAWTSLVTLMERTDATTVPDMDRPAEGIMSTYKSNGGRVLTEKTLKDDTGRPFNYMLVAFEEPAKQRFELNYVKVAMGAKNAYVMIIGIRVTDPKDYKTKAKEFCRAAIGGDWWSAGEGGPAGFRRAAAAGVLEKRRPGGLPHRGPRPYVVALCGNGVPALTGGDVC